MYESEQWTGTDCGHTPLTVDTQELASRVKTLTEWYLGSVCMKVNIYRPWTHTTDSGHTGIGQQREGFDGVLVRLCVYKSKQWTYTDRGHT